MEATVRQVFLEGRTHSWWLHKPVEPAILKEIYELARLGPTSANCFPLRILFITSKEAKAKLKPCLVEGNVEKTMQAPVTAVMAYDLKFYEHLPRLFPHTNARAWFEGNDSLVQETAYRNSTLASAYFIIAARALGLDCGPLSGFDNSMLDELFFSHSSWRSNFLCNLGYADHSKVLPRLPRLEFAEVCKII